MRTLQGMRDASGRRRPLGRAGAVVAWAGAAGALVYALLRVFGGDRGYVLDTAIAFTPHMAGAALLAVLLAVALRRWPAAGVALVACVMLAVAVLPRTIGDGPHPRGPELRVLTVNLHDGGASPAGLVALVRRERIDVVAVEESTQAVKGALIRAGLQKLLPHTDPQRFDTGIYSRVPLRRVVPVQGPLHSIELEAHVVVPGTGDVVIRVVHIHVLSRSGTGVWKRMLAGLPAARPQELRLIAGDFNATLDHSAFRSVLGRGYADAADRAGEGLNPTWPADQPLGITIDHVLVDRRIGVDRVRMVRLAGTDHRAVVADLTLPGRL